MMIKTIVSIDEQDKHWLDQQAKQTGLPITEIVRVAVKEYRKKIDAQTKEFKGNDPIEKITIVKSGSMLLSLDKKDQDTVLRDLIIANRQDMEDFEKLEIEKTITGGIEIKGSLLTAIDLLYMLEYISEKLLDIRVAAISADSDEKDKNTIYDYEADIDLEEMNAFIKRYKSVSGEKSAFMPSTSSPTKGV
jgi:hypothetical protein